MGRCTRSWPLTSWDFCDLNSVISHVIWHSISQTSEPPEGKIKSQINEGCIKCTLDWSVHVAFEIALLPAQNALFLSTLGCSSGNIQTCCLTHRSACLPPGFPLGLLYTGSQSHFPVGAVGTPASALKLCVWSSYVYWIWNQLVNSFRSLSGDLR